MFLVSHLHRALHQDNVSVNLFVVNKPWLFSLLWCAGVDSVTTNDCQLLQQMQYPVWIIVRPLGLSPLVFFPHPHLQFSLTPTISSSCISPHILPLGLWPPPRGAFSYPVAPSNLPNDVDHHQLRLHPVASVDLPPPRVSASCLSSLGLRCPPGSWQWD